MKDHMTCEIDEVSRHAFKDCCNNVKKRLVAVFEKIEEAIKKRVGEIFQGLSQGYTGFFGIGDLPQDDLALSLQLEVCSSILGIIGGIEAEFEEIPRTVDPDEQNGDKGKGLAGGVEDTSSITAGGNPTEPKGYPSSMPDDPNSDVLQDGLPDDPENDDIKEESLSGDNHSIGLEQGLDADVDLDEIDGVLQYEGSNLEEAGLLGSDDDEEVARSEVSEREPSKRLKVAEGSLDEVEPVYPEI